MTSCHPTMLVLVWSRECVCVCVSLWSFSPLLEGGWGVFRHLRTNGSVPILHKLPLLTPNIGHRSGLVASGKRVCHVLAAPQKAPSPSLPSSNGPERKQESSAGSVWVWSCTRFHGVRVLFCWPAWSVLECFGGNAIRERSCSHLVVLENRDWVCHEIEIFELLVSGHFGH